MSITIIIRETGKNEQTFTATVQFDPYGATYPIAVSNPFSAEDERRLEWYFEEWLSFPFTDKVPAGGCGRPAGGGAGAVSGGGGGAAGSVWGRVGVR